MMQATKDTLLSMSSDALRVLAARGLRAFADGFVGLLLPIYLVDLGFSSLAVGVIVASILIGTLGGDPHDIDRPRLRFRAGFLAVAGDRLCWHDESDLG